MRVHTYVIAVDAGSAPNYESPCVTLAVCKPRIRRKASFGDVVLAFAGKNVNPMEPHAIVWAGIVAEKMTFEEYWNDPRFAGKKPDRSRHPDNFYRPIDGGLLWVENPVHGPDAAHHDISGRFVLAFRPAWRFGAAGPLMPEEFGLRMTNGRRGERVVDLQEDEWSRLQTWLESQVSVEEPRASSKSRCRVPNGGRPTATAQRPVKRC